MTAVEKIDAEIARLDAVLARRGQWYEDEMAARGAFSQAALWLREEKDLRDQIEVEALAVAAAPAAIDPLKFKVRRV